MSRRPKTERVPRTRAGGEWTEAAFWGFLRSVLRQGSRKWPPLVRHAMQRGRRPYAGPNRRQKWEYQCAGCGEWFVAKQVHVDHIVPCGSLKSYEDLPGFVKRLFCEPDGLQVLCVDCNRKKGSKHE